MGFSGVQCLARLRFAAIEVALDAIELASLEAAGLSSYYGADQGAALRDVVFSWWESRFM